MQIESQKRFLLVEDQQLLRELLRTHLQTEFRDCEVVEIDTLAELNAVPPDSKFDLAIIDLLLPDGNTMNWALKWVDREDEPKVLMLTASDEDYVLYRAFNSKVQGFVHKNDDTTTLLIGIKAVLNEGLFFSESIKRLRSRMGSDPQFFGKILSTREQEILGYISQGLRNADIAKCLTPPLAEASIQDYRRNIMKKLGLHREVDLILWANQKGFSRIVIPPPDKTTS